MKIEHVQSLQPPYSMLNRDYENEIIPYCFKNGIGVVAYSPMQAGLLTGKFDITKLADDDWRKRSKFFNEPYLSKALKFVDSLKPIAERYNKTVANLSVAWVLKNQAVTSAIVGARNSMQTLENINSAEDFLNNEDYDKINELIKQYD